MRLSAFEGAWTMDRIIDDALTGKPGRLTGVTRFEADPLGLVCVEVGTLTLGDGPPVSASRRYLWREADGSIEVLFGDGRFFHGFDASAIAPVAFHDCPPDRYHVRYDFTRWPHWIAEWRVRGPRKDYSMVTSYHPA